MAKSLIDPEGRFRALVEPVVDEAGYKLVRVMLTSNKQDGQILQIMIEPGTNPNLNLDDCAAVSRSISALLEVEDPVSGAYRLEVSTPGIDRPLTRFEDFDRYKDFDAKVELSTPIETGQKRFRGVLGGTKEDVGVVLETDEGIYVLPFKEIKKASLVMTDKLMEASKEGRV